MYDVVVIGAGIVGCFIARELSKYDITVALIEKNGDVAGDATMANSGIIYNGYNSRTDKLKGRLTLRGNALFDQICQELNVPFKRIPMLMLGYDEEDLKTMSELYEKASANQVPGVQILTKEEVLQKEPLVNDNVIAAFYSPDCGLVSPWELGIALAENAVDNGVDLFLNSEVTGIEKTEDVFKIMAKEKEFIGGIVINCAGIYGDKISNMATSSSFSIIPKRGQYIVLDKNVDFPIHHVLSYCKTEKEKGVFIIPTLSGNLLIGPDMETIEDKEGIETTAERIKRIHQSSQKISNQIPTHQVIRSFSGLKAKCDVGDFLIEESKEVSQFINVVGINMPGITCSPSIAEYVTQMVDSIYSRQGKRLTEKSNFHPHRTSPPCFKDLSAEEKRKKIQEDPRYGKVICRCEMVTEGEIVEAIHRNVGAHTVKAIKKRTRASMGRCQGGFCEPRIVEILARELNKEMNEIVSENENSYILREPLK